MRQAVLIHEHPIEGKKKMTDLPSELSTLVALIDAQPSPVCEAFRYCIALGMAAAGKIRLVQSFPGENGMICVFESSEGKRFTLAKPAMTEEQEATVKAMLRVILEAGWP
jgi:hypothetical protein